MNSEEIKSNRLSKEAEKILSHLSLEEKVGQLFILAFPGKDPGLFFQLIERYQVGGCYLSQDNAETFSEAKNLTQNLQSKARAKHPQLPLLLGVDQEGAWGVLIPEATIGPGNLALGAVDDPDLTREIYAIFAQEMRSVGYSLILGPCSDINLNPNNPIIGTRSFGSYPLKVAVHVSAAIKGIHQGGALAAAKHFPGHGDTQKDTHREIPTVGKNRSQLDRNELLPFVAAVDTGLDIMMTSHILFPELDSRYPATLSYPILNHLLREEMKFQGLIITDSMNMGAMRKYFSLEESTCLALEAGANLIMLSEEHYDHRQDYLEKQIVSIESIIRAVKEKRISVDLLNDRVGKVIDFKLNKLLPIIDDSITGFKPLNPQHKKMEEEIARQAVVLVKNESDLLPLKKKTKIALVNATPVSSYRHLTNPRGIGPNQKQPAFEALKESLSPLCHDLTIFSHEKLKLETDQLSSFELVLLVTEDYPLPGEDFEKKEQLSLIKKLLQHWNDRILVLGLRSPYEVSEFPQVKNYLTTHSSRTVSARILGPLLFDDQFFKGSRKLPVDL